MEQRFEHEQVRIAAYRALLEHLSADLLARRCTLGEATTRLAESERGRDPTWIATLRLYYPGRSDAGCLACSLCEYAAAQARRLPARDRWVATWRLRRQLRRFPGGAATPTKLVECHRASPPSGPATLPA